MEKDYTYKENIIWFAEKQIIFREKIAELIEFEKCIIIRNKYTNENPPIIWSHMIIVPIKYGKSMISLSL